jgi:hypothetical protein
VAIPQEKDMSVLVSSRRFHWSRFGGLERGGERERERGRGKSFFKKRVNTRENGAKFSFLFFTISEL